MSALSALTLKMHYLKMTDKKNGVWKIQDWRMTDKLAGTRVSVLSVLTLWLLCQMAVRCVVYLLTWICVCFLMCIWRTIVRHFSN